MLNHAPLGIGHPYRYEPDQRIPIYPISGQAWKARARSDEMTKKVFLHLQRELKSEIYELNLIGSAQSDDHGPYGQTAKYIGSNTHLADAAARSGEYPGELQWEIDLPILFNFEEVTYWFESDCNERTIPFSFSALAWAPDENGFFKVTTGFDVDVQCSDIEILRDSTGRIFSLRASLPLTVNDRVVGFGERFNSIDQRGEFVDAVVYEEYKGQGHRTYLPAPFGMVIGSNYGFYVKTSTPTRFDVGVSKSDRLIIEIDIAPGQSECEIKIYGGDCVSILKQYISEFELPKAPPNWIYSLWGSSNEWNTQARVEEEIALSLAHGIDLGVIVLEAWSDESTFAVFRDAVFTPNDGSIGLHSTQITYPRDGAWPNPAKMIDDIHSQGSKCILWQIPVIKDQGEPGSQIRAIWNHAIENNLVIKDASGRPYRVPGFWFRDGLLPDLTDSKVRKWWGDLHKYLLTEMCIDGFKTDGGEHAWGSDLRYLDGGLGIEKNNLFPVAYAQTFHELISSTQSEAIIFSRAGFAGSSSYPTFWAGDEDSTWDAYRASIRAGITASASGIFFWGWDIAGFSGALPSTDLYLRASAMATFCPIMQFHSEFNHHQIPSNDRTPWNIAEQNGSPEVISIFRSFASLRKRLIPYLSAEGKKAIETGRPLMAGLFFDYFDDEEIWKAPYQYMLGTSLLIAPVTQPNTKGVEVYLPEGTWMSLWRDEEFTGKQWIHVEAPVGEIPVFVAIAKSTEIKGLLF